MNVDSTDSAYITPALLMASCTMVEIDPKQNHGVHMSHIQLGWSFCRGKVSCVIDWQRPKKRAIGRKPKLKEEICCCRQCVGAQLVPFDSPPPIF